VLKILIGPFLGIRKENRENKVSTISCFLIPHSFFSLNFALYIYIVNFLWKIKRFDSCNFFNPIVAKVGGLQNQGAKGEAVVNLLLSLGNTGSGALRLSRRVNSMASNRLHPLNSPKIGIRKWNHF